MYNHGHVLKWCICIMRHQNRGQYALPRSERRMVEQKVEVKGKGKGCTKENLLKREKLKCCVGKPIIIT